MNSWNKLSKLVRLLVRRERDIHPAIIAPATYDDHVAGLLAAVKRRG